MKTTQQIFGKAALALALAATCGAVGAQAQRHARLAEDGQQPEVFVEVDQAAQVINVVDIRVIRVQFDEAVAGGEGGRGFAGFPVGVGDVDLRLLGETAVGITRFEFFVVFDGLFVGTLVHRFLGGGVQLVGRPADGFVLDFRQQSATGNEGGKKKGSDYR